MPSLHLVMEQCLAAVPGGAGRYAEETARALAAGRPPGWTIRGVTAWHRDLGPATVPGIAGPSRLPAGSRTLAELWFRGVPLLPAGDIVHALSPLAPPRARRGQKLVANVHDVVPWTHPETLTPRGVRWHRTMIARIGRTADAIVTLTDGMADALARYAGIRDRLVVIPPGITPSLSAPARPDDIRSAQLRHHLPDRYLVTVGTLEPRKGLDVLLDALTLPGTGDLAAAIIGPAGWGDLDLVTEARRRGVGHRVFPLGRLTDPEVNAVVSGAVVAVQPSRAEGFGFPVVEAMAQGVPVIHSDAQALVEVAGGAGMTVPIGDPDELAAAIARVADDRDLAADRIAAGFARAREFSWAAGSARLWELYAELLAR